MGDGTSGKFLFMSESDRTGVIDFNCVRFRLASFLG